MPTPEEIAAAEKAKADEAAKAAEVEAPKKEAETKKVETETLEEDVFDKDRAMATIRKLREQEKQFRKEEKELEQLRAEKKQRDEAEMTESEKAKKRADEAEAKAAKLELDILRRDVIAETGLPPLFADRLKGSTREEMLADAEALKKELPALKTTPKIGATNPDNGRQVETEAQKRERLFGSPGNIFDFDAIKRQGGGVFWKTPKE